MKIIDEIVYRAVECLEKKIKDKNNTSDFAPIVYENRYDFQQQALEVCNALSQIKDPKAQGYRLRMMKVLSDITRIKER